MPNSETAMMKKVRYIELSCVYRHQSRAVARAEKQHPIRKK